MRNNKRWAVLSLVLILVMVVPVSTVASPTASPSRSDAAPEFMQPETGVDVAAEVPAKYWIVQLADPPLAQYAGGIPSLAATAPSVTGAVRLDVNTPEAQAYIAYLEAQQAQVAAAVQKVVPQASIDRDYQVVFNGLAVTLPEADEQAGRWLSRLPGVKTAYRQQAYYPDMYASLPLIDAPTLWGQVGGQSEAGRGIKIASIDAGIYAGNDCFDPTGYSYPPGFPKGDTSVTTEKVITARAYFRSDDPPTPGDEGTLPGENGSSHGTHTSGTMACVPNTVATTAGYSETISGVAPAAYLMSYKVFYPTTSPWSGSAWDAELIAAIEDAVVDGADVVNNSWGGGSSAVISGALDQAFDAAWDAGMVVAFSAGNSGPYPSTVDHPSEKLILVGASTTDGTIASGRLSVTAPEPISPTLQNMAFANAAFGGVLPSAVYTFTLASAEVISPTNSEGCDPWPADTFTGKAALISRGTCEFGVKVLNAENGGAEFVIVHNHATGGDALVTMGPGAVGDQVTIPSVFVGYTNGRGMVDWYQTYGDASEVTFDLVGFQAGNIPDRLASFSSRGPSIRQMIKPDVVAPGVNILSAGYGTGTGVARHEGFGQASGTSMAAPHVAGAAAVLLQLHPDWTPAQIKSALMSTAETDLADFDGSAVGVLDHGAGRIDLGHAGDPGLTFDKPSVSFGGMYAGASDSMTVKATDVFSRAAGTPFAYTLSISETGDMTTTAYFTLSVSPATLAFDDDGAMGSFDVTMEIADGAPAGDYEGWVWLRHGPHMLHLPVWARVWPPMAANPVLLIDNDFSDLLGFPDYTGFYTATLEALGVGYDYYNADLHFANDQTFPDLATLQRYKVVIWYTGDNFYPDGTFTVQTPPTEADQDILIAYLQGGGRLLATGQDLASASDIESDTNPSFGRSGLYHSFLGAYYVQDDIFGGGPGSFPPSPSASGVPNSFATGFSLDLSVPISPSLTTGAGNQFYVDEVTPDWVGVAPQPAGGDLPAKPFLSAINGLSEKEGYVGLTRGSEPMLEKPVKIFDGRTVYLAFGFEGIRDDTGGTTRAQFMNALLHQLIAEPSVSVDLAPGSGTVALPFELVRLEASAMVTDTLGTLSLPEQPTAVQYRWDFGDGSRVVTGSGSQAGHVYDQYGIYHVRVEVTDSYGHRAVSDPFMVMVGRVIYLPIVFKNH